MLDRVAKNTPVEGRIWPDDGRPWVIRPRASAPALDSYMTFAHLLGAEGVRFKSYETPFFTLYDDNYRCARAPLDELEMAQIVSHLYGADGMARLQGGTDLNVMYVIKLSRTESLRFRVNMSSKTTSRGDGVDIAIRCVKNLPPLLDEQNVEPEILSAYRPDQGLVIVSGGTGSGKSTLIAGMTMAKLLDPAGHYVILEGAEPIEFLLDRVRSETSTISQSDIPRNFKTFEAYLESTMRRKPTDIIVGECKNGDTMAATIVAAISGHRAVSTTHANDVPSTMQRIAVLCPLAERQTLTIAAAQALRLVVNQRLVKSTDGKRIALREFLVFDAPLRRLLSESSSDLWPRIARDAVKAKGQTYEKAIQKALAEGRITEDIAAKARQAEE
ncbi:type IV pilus twitching motility protein PilT [Methylocapsa palsarum]|uniref:Defect in organelle trafficking protein DotB n=1 Tax=Methylocapsa palsarum TaxID=1612308 RepID=A0A1I4DG23_9HYPH|nr:ATPase, T2SS/T4P/T4SS family [Methylocapsa palsarum]SFK90821.1 defect in organelle trafficking protein DotB [Methylocapsa palsarum]